MKSALLLLGVLPCHGGARADLGYLYVESEVAQNPADSVRLRRHGRVGDVA